MFREYPGHQENGFVVLVDKKLVISGIHAHWSIFVTAVKCGRAVIGVKSVRHCVRIVSKTVKLLCDIRTLVEQIGDITADHSVHHNDHYVLSRSSERNDAFFACAFVVPDVT